MQPLYRVATIREAERPILETLANLGTPDALMMSAAEAVAQAALEILHAARPHATRRALAEGDSGKPGPQTDSCASAPLLILAGSGGNGGDALFAGARLALSGHRATSVLLGAHPHEAALKTFTRAGGRVLDAQSWDPMLASEARLAIDGITGLGGRPGLRPVARQVVADLERARVPVLSVDLPSGIVADTGQTLPPGADGLPTHVTATATVTFGGLRRAHGLSTACGEVLLADIQAAGESLAARLSSAQPGGLREELVRGVGSLAPLPPNDAPPRLSRPAVFTLGEDPEPGAQDDKYSQGVAGVLAGSAAYPGAGILALGGALRSTPGMVRYVGRLEAIADHHPEVVRADSLEHCGRVQAWVFGPGRGTGEEAAAELEALLRRPEPVIIDADGLTVLAQNPALRWSLGNHGRCLLTPHAGEFARLAGPQAAADPDRNAAALELAQELGCVVVLKGRLTAVAGANQVSVIDCEHSWAATPGSGDVLAGALGAIVAREQARAEQGSTKTALAGIDADGLHAAAVEAVSLHARAAWIAAQTPEGPAPILARDIVAALPRAIAQARSQALGR